MELSFCTWDDSYPAFIVSAMNIDTRADFCALPKALQAVIIARLWQRVEDQIINGI